MDREREGKGGDYNSTVRSFVSKGTRGNSECALRKRAHMHACRFLQRHISDHRSVTHTRGISQESRFERQLRPLLSANDGSKRTARAILCADVLRADESRSTRLVYAQWRGGGGKSGVNEIAVKTDASTTPCLQCGLD